MPELHKFVLVLTVVFIASGCSQDRSGPYEAQNIETIEVSGMDSVQTISTDKPSKVVVSGMNSNVTIQRGSNITELVISGMDSVVYLPEGLNPAVDVSGQEAELVRY